jgi:hypothetical protein
MSKKPRRRQLVTDQVTDEIVPAEPANEVDRPKLEAPPVLTSVMLNNVREAALRVQHDTARNIAELESWRAEIDATVAFLKAQRK